MSVGDDITTKDKKDEGALVLKPNGKIEIYDEDEDGKEISYVLKLPRFKQFKEIKSALFEANQKVKDRSDELGLTPPDMNDAAALAAYVSKSEEVVDLTWEGLDTVMDLVFALLSNNGRPIDWPTWLIADQQPISAMLTHWRTVPLGRG